MISETLTVILKTNITNLLWTKLDFVISSYENNRNGQYGPTKLAFSLRGEFFCVYLFAYFLHTTHEKLN
jgi:hypothetical protein